MCCVGVLFFLLTCSRVFSISVCLLGLCVCVFFVTTRLFLLELPPPPPPGENKDFLDGIGSAGSSLARGLSDGVSGLIKNPLRGAESGGFAGFAKGVGTGMLGLVVKPVVGVTDAATDVLQGAVAAFVSLAFLVCFALFCFVLFSVFFFFFVLVDFWLYLMLACFGVCVL